jgi:hypothetical protein
MHVRPETRKPREHAGDQNAERAERPAVTDESAFRRVAVGRAGDSSPADATAPEATTPQSNAGQQEDSTQVYITLPR